MLYHVKRSKYALVLSNRLDLYNHSLFISKYFEKISQGVTSPTILVYGRIIINITPMLVEDLQRAAGKVTSTSEHH